MVDYIEDEKFMKMAEAEIKAKQDVIDLMAGINNPRRTFYNVEDTSDIKPMEAKVSTIRIHKEVKKMLKEKKLYDSETYEAVISRLMFKDR